MGSDVQAVTVTGTGAATSSRCRLQGLEYTGDAVGDIVITLTDGNGGTTRLTYTGLTDETEDLDLPGRGILFQNGIYVSVLTNAASVTMFYEG